MKRIKAEEETAVLSSSFLSFSSLPSVSASSSNSFHLCGLSVLSGEYRSMKWQPSN
jgi:hypothetical protein